MKMQEMTVVRLYFNEEEHRLQKLVRYLHDEAQVRGVTVYRAIEGFDETGKIHGSGLIDLSLDLPLVVECFDTPEKMTEVMIHLNEMIEPGHMLSWSAQLNTAE